MNRACEIGLAALVLAMLFIPLIVVIVGAFNTGPVIP